MECRLQNTRGSRTARNLPRTRRGVGVGGIETPRLARTRTCVRPRHSASRRADKPPRHRLGFVARKIPEIVRKDACVRVARQGVFAESCKPRCGGRPRQTHRLRLRLRRICAPSRRASRRPRAQRGGLRQKARAGGGVASQGRQGAAHAQRGQGARAYAPARNPPRPPRENRRREPARAGGSRGRSEGAGRKERFVFVRRLSDCEKLFDDRFSRRQNRDNRAQRHRQNDAA